MPDSGEADVIDAETRQRLQDTVLRFATAVDTLDFDLYRATFAEECLYDLTSFNGAAPCLMKVADWVTVIEPMLRGFDATLHFLSNFTFERAGDDLRVGAYVLAEHLLKSAGGDEMASVGGRYTFTLRPAPGGFRIHGFRIEVLWQRGDTGLYARAAALTADGYARRP